MYQVPKHKVFVSFHHEDQYYKDLFTQMMEDDIVDESVEDGDIDDRNLSTEAIRQRIRDEFISDATVTVVLIGPCTWQRKHVDWEIGSSLRYTQRNPRCGLLGILLPTHPDYRKREYTPNLVPPRLADNCVGNDPFAKIYDWQDGSQGTAYVREWIHEAFKRRTGTPINNSRPQFGNNRTGNCHTGWKD